MPPSLSFFFFLFSYGQRHDASVVCFGIIFRRIFIALERSLSVLSEKSAGCRMLLASAVKRRRLNGKQPSPPAYTSEAADGQHAVASDLILPVEPSLHPTEGHLGEDFGPDDLFPCADSADGPSSLDNGPEDPLQPSRWSFLGRGKTVQSLVAAIAKEKTDAELHAFTVGELLKEVFHRGGGKVTMAELEEARDDFISASMAIVPRELSRRLVSAVANPAKEQGNKKKQESDPKKLGGPPLQGDPVDIDCTTVQKTYLLTVSGLNAASVPEHQEILNLALQSFVEAGYPASVYPTHMAVFREPHQDGGMHFHIATAFSEPFRWIGWKKALQSHGKVVHFSNMAIDHHSRHRQMQYAYMLRYLWLPSKKKPLTALDKEPLLWCRHGKSHPPLLDAINGALSCEAIQEKVAEAFLHRYAVGKRTTAKFTMSSCGLL
jgi:hypothetical protein